MSENKISVTRALAELKLLEKRISKLTECRFISSSYNSFNTTEQEMRSNFSSLQDLTKRYEAIKFAIIRSNAETGVKIGNRVYTVAEAIAMKDYCIKHKSNLLDVLRRQRKEVTDAVEVYNRQVQEKLDKLLEISFKERKTDENEMKTIKEAYLKSNEIKVNDPLNLDLRISQLSEEIDKFLSEVDYSLSESNATTMISA